MNETTRCGVPPCLIRPGARRRAEQLSGGRGTIRLPPGSCSGMSRRGRRPPGADAAAPGARPDHRGPGGPLGDQAGAIGIAAVSVALCAGVLASLWLGLADYRNSDDVSGDLVVGSFVPVVGALIAVREPGNRCSRVLLSAGLVAVSAFSHEPAHDELARPGFLPLAPVAVWLSGWTRLPDRLHATLLPCSSAREGPVPAVAAFVTGVLIVIAAATVVAMFKPILMSKGSASTTAGDRPGRVGPRGASCCSAGLAPASGRAGGPRRALRRQRRAVGRTRRSGRGCRWAPRPALSRRSGAPPEGSVPGVHYGLTVAFGLIPLAIVIAVVDGLFDVELVVNRAVVTGPDRSWPADDAALRPPGSRGAQGRMRHCWRRRLPRPGGGAVRFQRFVDGGCSGPAGIPTRWCAGRAFPWPPRRTR